MYPRNFLVAMADATAALTEILDPRGTPDLRGTLDTGNTGYTGNTDPRGTLDTRGTPTHGEHRIRVMLDLPELVSKVLPPLV